MRDRHAGGAAHDRPHRNRYYTTDFFFGTHTNANTNNLARTRRKGAVEVIDNVDIAPRVPVRPGDRVEVCGEIVHDPGKSAFSLDAS